MFQSLGNHATRWTLDDPGLMRGEAALLRVPVPPFAGTSRNSFVSLWLGLDQDLQNTEKKPARPWIGIYAATAVMMAIALGVLAWQAKVSRQEIGPKEVVRATTVPAERYELLAQFDPPAYKARKNPGEFESAMRDYGSHDYAGAVRRLQAFTANHQTNVEARFYLGISLLLDNNRTAGIAELRNVISSGQAPYVEQAGFYAAKALLGAHDVRAAQEQLQQVINLHGDLAKQAEILLQQLKP